MSTVVIMPVSQSPTITHRFKTTTSAGREMVPTVTAMRDVRPQAVLDDLRKSFPPDAIVEPYDDPNGFGTVLGIWAMLWIFVGVVFAVGAMVADMAGLVALVGITGPASTWPAWIPMIGSLNVGPGLVRLWLVLGPALLAFLTFAWSVSKDRDADRLR